MVKERVKVISMVFCRAREMPRLLTQPQFPASEYPNAAFLGTVMLRYKLFYFPGPLMQGGACLPQGSMLIGWLVRLSTCYQ